MIDHISLFSGIGGFDLASEWMGWRNIASCEINPFGRQVLQYYWPDAYHHDDIHTLTYEKIHEGLSKKYGEDWRTNDIVLSGGFPCQPYSAAGKRLGKEDERHLWPQMLRVIREVAPRWVVGENVRGLLNWNGGVVFDEVQTELEAEGYEVIPFLLPACGKNAPHRRERIWIVAHSGKHGNPQQGKGGEAANPEKPRERAAPDPNGQQRRKRGLHQDRRKEAERHAGARNAFSYRRGAWDDFPTQSPICSGDDGISKQLDGITFPKWRNESIKAYGNAIVPQVAYEIFRALMVGQS